MGRYALAVCLNLSANELMTVLTAHATAQTREESAMRINITVTKNWSTGKPDFFLTYTSKDSDMSYFWLLAAIETAGSKLLAWKKLKIGHKYIRTVVVTGDLKQRIRCAKRAGSRKDFALAYVTKHFDLEPCM